MARKEEDKRLKVGDVISGPGCVYQVVKENAFGPLPRAEIVSGPNVGIKVYLTRWSTL